MKEGTSAVLLQSGLGNEWWADSMECYCYLRNIETASVWSKSLASYIPRICVARGVNLERRHYSRRHRRIGGDGRIRSPRQKAQCKGIVNAAKKRKLHIPSRRWNSQNLRARTASENIHLKPGTGRTRRGTRNSSRKNQMNYILQPTSRRLNAG